MQKLIITYRMRIIICDRVNKMKLFKLIVHQKNFSGWYSQIDNTHYPISFQVIGYSFCYNICCKLTVSGPKHIILTGQNYWVFGLRPLFGTRRNTREHNVSGTEFVSVVRLKGRHLLSWVHQKSALSDTQQSGCLPPRLRTETSSF